MVTWKTKFYLESKACLIHVSSIASFKPFLIARLWGYCAFSDSSVVSLISSPFQNTPSTELFYKNKTCSTIKLFCSSHMFFIRLFLASTWKKGRASPCSFKRKGEFISLSSFVWGKSLTFCTRTRPCARAEWRENRAQYGCAMQYWAISYSISRYNYEVFFLL